MNNPTGTQVESTRNYTEQLTNNETANLLEKNRKFAKPIIEYMLRFWWIESNQLDLYMTWNLNYLDWSFFYNLIRCIEEVENNTNLKDLKVVTLNDMYAILGSYLDDDKLRVYLWLSNDEIIDIDDDTYYFLSESQIDKITQFLKENFPELNDKDDSYINNLIDNEIINDSYSVWDWFSEIEREFLNRRVDWIL